MAFICFDLDNTLIHADRAHYHAYQEALKLYADKFNVYPLPEKKLINTFGRVGRVIIKEFFPHLTQKQLTTILSAHHKILLKGGYKKARVIPGVKRTLAALKKHHTLAIVTNCHTTTMNKLMTTTGINKKLFKARIGNDQVHHPKPAPDEIHKAEHILHLKADYMVGDTIYDMIAARKARVKGVGVLTGTTSKKKLQDHKAYAVLKTVNELPAFLEQDL